MAILRSTNELRGGVVNSTVSLQKHINYTLSRKEGNAINQPEHDLTLGQHLEAARQQAGYSLRQLANVSDVHVSVVNRLLKDRTEQPMPSHLVALARALELNATDLFLLAGLPVPEEAASLDIMLRKGYGVSEDELPELHHEIEELIAKHHRESNDNQQREGQSV